MAYARKALGALLRAQRRHLDLRLLDVAEGIGRSVPYLSEVERGLRAISPQLLEKLALFLKLPEVGWERAFLLRKRLPPGVEKHFLTNPKAWPRGARAA